MNLDSVKKLQTQIRWEVRRICSCFRFHPLGCTLPWSLACRSFLREWPWQQGGRRNGIRQRSQSAMQVQQQAQPTLGSSGGGVALLSPQDLLRSVIGHRTPPWLRQSLEGLSAEDLRTALLVAGATHPSGRKLGGV